jgi:hypothetical protein
MFAELPNRVPVEGLGSWAQRKKNEVLFQCLEDRIGRSLFFRFMLNDGCFDERRAGCSAGSSFSIMTAIQPMQIILRDISRHLAQSPGYTPR